MCDFEYMDEKYAFLAVFDPYIHVAWRVGDIILVAEDIYVNYPRFSVATFRSLDEYLEAIRDVEWIMDNIGDREVKDIAEEFNVSEEYVREKLGLRGVPRSAEVH